MTTDVDYHRARALEERECAATASDANIANIHRDLAAKYEALAGEAEGQPTLRPGWVGTVDRQFA